AGMHPDRDNQPVAKGDGMPDHVQVAVGDGIEGAGIKRDTGHMSPLTRPAPPGKVPRLQAGAEPYFAPANEPLARSPRLLGGRPLFRPNLGHETNRRWDETIFRFGEDVRKRVLVT